MGDRRHPFATPSGKIGDKDVLAEVHFWLVEQDPAARPSSASLEGRPEFLAKSARGRSVRARGPRMRVEHAVDQLDHKVCRGRKDIRVRCSFAGRVGHSTNVANREPTATREDVSRLKIRGSSRRHEPHRTF